MHDGEDMFKSMLNGPNGDILKSARSGLQEGAIRAPFMLGDLSTFGMNQFDRLFDKNAPQRPMQSDQVLNILADKTGAGLHVPETPAGRYTNTAANAVGGGVIGGLGAFRVAPSLGRLPGAINAVKDMTGRAIQTPMVQNAVTGAATELSGDLSRNMDDTKLQDPTARFAGGTAAALTQALISRNIAPRYGGAVHQSTKGMTPADWEAANVMKGKLDAAGATSTTIPDLVPTTSPLRGVAAEISNAPGGQSLFEKLAGRQEGDITKLLGDAKRMGQTAAAPNVSPLPGVAGADDMVSQVAANNRFNAYNPILEKAPLLPEENFKAVLRALQAKSDDPLSYAGLRSNLSDAQKTLNLERRYPMPQPIPPQNFTGPPAPVGEGLNLPAVVSATKSLDMVGATQGARAGEVVKTKAAVDTTKAADIALKAQSPEYKTAMETFARMSPQVDLAELLAKNKLGAIPNRATSSLGDDQIRQEIEFLMGKIAPKTAPLVRGKLDAADQLSKLTAQRGAQAMESQYGSTPLGALAAPAMTVSRGSTITMKRLTTERLAEILANPTPQNMKMIEELSKSDPVLRRVKAMFGNVGAIDAAGQTEGSKP